MLRKASTLFGHSLLTSDDEEMGKVQDFYFDRDTWTVRYLVVDIGSWLFGRQVLIATSAVGAPVWDGKIISVDLTKAQVKDSPNIDLALPITRQHEMTLMDYYGWPSYWGAPLGEPVLRTPVMAGGLPLAHATPATTGGLSSTEAMPEEVVTALQNTEESNIYSMSDTKGYTIEAIDGGIGHVEDFFVDDQDWTIRYLLIDTGNWLPGKRVLVGPRWVNTVDWHEGRFYIKLDKSQVEKSPEYDPRAPLERTYERELHRHYGYPEYW